MSNRGRRNGLIATSCLLMAGIGFLAWFRNLSNSALEDLVGEYAVFQIKKSFGKVDASGVKLETSA